ncbi:MAG: type II secretion system protein GspG [Akkermansiaceae bacterium]|nr:type II secretion system protein GspG [Akkermansiaceae bacterium]
MKTPRHPQGFRAPAFTLIELMVVIAIILVLASMVVGGMGWYKRKAAEGKTQVLVSSIERALEEYKLDNGVFPTGGGGDNSTIEVYKALYGDADANGTPDSGAKVYLEILNPSNTGNKLNVDTSNYTIIDAWGSPLHYQSPGEMNPADDFDLWSLGANGQGGPASNNKKDKADDIKNW